MRKRLLFNLKILIVFLSCNLGTAFAEHGPIIKSLQNDPHHNALKSSPCKGISNSHTKIKQVALTFDDGPNKKYTEQVREILKLNNIKGTFFFVGKNVKEYPEIVKAVFEDGNVIGNHSYSHLYLNSIDGERIANQLTVASKSISDVIGFHPVLYRPPYGACSVGSVRVARNLHLKTIMWSVTADDYREGNTPGKIASEIISQTQPGSIIILHDGGGKRENTVEALKIIISTLRNEGYEFVTVPELLDLPAYTTNPPSYEP